MVQVFPLAALQAFWLPAEESGKFGKFAAWQFSPGLQTAVAGFPQREWLTLEQAAPLSEHVPFPQKPLPGGPATPPVFKQSRAATQAACAALLALVVGAHTMALLQAATVGPKTRSPTQFAWPF